MIQSGHGMRDGRTDGRTDGRSETSIPPQQLRCAGGIIICICQFGHSVELNSTSDSLEEPILTHPNATILATNPNNCPDNGANKPIHIICSHHDGTTLAKWCNLILLDDIQLYAGNVWCNYLWKYATVNNKTITNKNKYLPHQYIHLELHISRNTFRPWARGVHHATPPPPPPPPNPYKTIFSEPSECPQ